MPLEGDRHRQPAHGRSCPSRQGQQRPRCDPVAQAVGSFARLLEMEKTQDVLVSQLLLLSPGKTDHLAYGVVCSARSSATCGYQEEGISTFVAPQLGDAPTGTWNRSENDPGPARSLLFGSNHHLSPPLSTSLARC